MSFLLREWRRRLWGTFRHRDSETDEELRFHLQMAEEDALRRGQSVRDARLRVGGAAQAAEAVRDQNGIRWFADFFRDSRHAVRLLGKSPLFTTAAILSLSLGIGGITAMFSVFDAVLIRPLPYAHADRLAMIWLDMPNADITSRHAATPAEWLEWRRLNTVFTDLACSQPAAPTLSGDGEPEQLPARKVTWNFWSVLGVQPMLGRAFTEEEDNKGVHVAVISHGLWQRRFGGSRDIVGRKISLNDEPYKVIGVMPQGFYFMPARDIDIWMPASFPSWMRRNFTWHDAEIVARLKPGLTLEQTRHSMRALSLQVTAQDFRGPHSVIVIPLREEIAGRTQTALILLLCASGAVLLIACVISRIFYFRVACRAAAKSRYAERSAQVAEGLSRNFLRKAWCSPRSVRLPGSLLPFPPCDFSKGLCPRPWEPRASRSIGVCWRFPRPSRSLLR
jgi:hypothetical protein